MNAFEVLDRMAQAIYDERRQAFMMEGWQKLDNNAKQCYRYEVQAAIRAFRKAVPPEEIGLASITSLLGVEP